MDEGFWASVVEKWSEAAKLVIGLKRELSATQEENSHYRSQLQALHLNDIAITNPNASYTLANQTNISLETQDLNALSRLREAEEGLEKAKAEYQRLKEQLHASKDEMESLTAENANMKKERHDLILSRHQLSQEAKRIEASLALERLDNQALQEQMKAQIEINRLKEEALRRLQRQQTAACASAVENEWKMKALSLMKEVDELRGTAEDQTAEIDRLREEMTSLRDSLHKAKENNRALVATVSTVQNLARHVMVPTPDTLKKNPQSTSTPKHPRAISQQSKRLSSQSSHQSVNESSKAHKYALGSLINNQLSPRIKVTTSPIKNSKRKISSDRSTKSAQRSAKLSGATSASASSPKLSASIGAGNSVQHVTGQIDTVRVSPSRRQSTIKFPESIFTGPDAALGSMSSPSMKRRSTNRQTADLQNNNTDLFNNDDTTVVDVIRLGPNIVLPEHRQRVLDKLPVAIPDIKTVFENNAFDRRVFKTGLGGHSQSRRMARSHTNLAIMLHIIGYLCPGLDHNPWCPSIPGQNGYLFVGLGREANSFEVPEIRHVFVGKKDTSLRRRRFTYLGTYKVTRVEPLSIDEWGALPQTHKRRYAAATIQKTGDERLPFDIMAAYDQGALQVPCVQLQCIGFDEELFAALLARQKEIMS